MSPSIERDSLSEATLSLREGPAGVFSSIMRVTYDAKTDAAYLYLTDDPLSPGRDSVPCDVPEGVHAMVVMDWKDGRIVGLEVLDASKLLHRDLLDNAQKMGQ